MPDQPLPAQTGPVEPGKPLDLNSLPDLDSPVGAFLLWLLFTVYGSLILSLVLGVFK